MKRKGLSSENQKESKTRKKFRDWFRWRYIAVLTGALLLLTYLGVSVYYMNHFYKGTIINHVNCSNMTPEEADAKIKEVAKTYVLTLEERNDLTEQIKGSDFDMVYVLNGDLRDVKGNQNGFLWPYCIFADSEETVPSSIEFDAGKFDDVLNGLTGMQKDYMKKPVNAKISVYLPERKAYEIVPEDNGSTILKERFAEKCREAVQFLKPTLSLEQEGCYKEVSIKADSKELKRVLKTLNRYVKTEITYQFGEKTEVLDGDLIHQFLRRKKNSNQITLSDGFIKEYIKNLARKYDTFGKSREFKTNSGKQITISGGDYGWWMDQAKEFKELKKLIERGKKKERKPIYFQKAVEYGKLDYGNTYVEINLNAQHMYFYKNGKKVLETDVVTGNPSRGNESPTGIFGVMYKEHGAVLRGEDYETPVEFWMPFSGDVGLHDATWRSSFGGNIYRSNGSHGCINMPYAKAKQLFQMIEQGTPVICY